jgi:hypothetical protein
VGEGTMREQDRREEMRAVTWNERYEGVLVGA